MKRIPGMPGTSPEPLGIPGIRWARGTPGHAIGTPGTPLGPPGDAPRSRWGPQQTSKTALCIARRMYSARSSRLLCSNMLVGTHRLKNSPRPCFVYKKAAKIKSTGVVDLAMEKNEATIMPPWHACAYILHILYIIYIYTYTCVWIYIYIW